jgi:hypothetical protein
MLKICFTILFLFVSHLTVGQSTICLSFDTIRIRLTTSDIDSVEVKQGDRIKIKLKSCGIEKLQSIAGTDLGRGVFFDQKRPKKVIHLAFIPNDMSYSPDEPIIYRDKFGFVNDDYFEIRIAHLSAKWKKKNMDLFHTLLDSL